MGSNFTDAQGDWLAKPNAALYISGPGPQASDDIIIILTLREPFYSNTDEAVTYTVSLVLPSMAIDHQNSM